MIDTASVEKDALEETRKELPTANVDRIVAFGGLYFSNREFYHLIARVEKVFESSLTIMNLLFSGASLVAELLSQLKENNHIREAMRSMLPTGTTEVELKRCYIMSSEPIPAREGKITSAVTSHVAIQGILGR
jgi:hypothetical protein